MTPTKALATCGANQTGVSIYDAPPQHSSSLLPALMISSLLPIPKQSPTLQHLRFVNVLQLWMGVTHSGCSAATYAVEEINVSSPWIRNNTSLASYLTSVWSIAMWSKHCAPFFILYLTCVPPLTKNDMLPHLFLTMHWSANACTCPTIPDQTSPSPFENLLVSCQTMVLNITKLKNTSYSTFREPAVVA